MNKYTGNRKNNIENVLKFKSLKRHGKKKLSEKKFAELLNLISIIWHRTKNPNIKILGFNRRKNLLIYEQDNQIKRFKYDKKTGSFS